MSNIKSHGRGKRKPSTANSYSEVRPLTLPTGGKPKRSYTPEQLREMRKRKGIGRPPKVT